MTQKLELLAPAGTLQTLKAVIHAGADAVYFGGSQFGARAYAGNFNREEVLEAIDFGHIHGSRVILAVNTLLKERELEEQLYDYLLPYYEQGLDAVIVQDFGVMQFIRENFKGLPIHTSTQMTVANVEGARFLAEQGAERIVLARELSLEEIRRIHEAVPVELESFVHGALCYCYSGQCLLSSMLGGRSGNRGRCAQPCRLPYEVFGQNKKKISDNLHAYPLSPKDLCTIDMIPRLAESGICSFKIEGRMKRTEYAAGVVSVYRKYMDQYLNHGAKSCRVTGEDHQKLFDLGNRSGFTDGYYQRWNGPDMITFQKPGHEKSNDRLWKQIAEDYMQSEPKEKITGILTVNKDMPVSLTVSWKGEKSSVTGEIPMPAKKQPVTRETLREKILKTGNTPFIFEKLKINLSEGLFLPVAAVNDLRRRGLEQLEQQFLEKYRRTAEDRTESVRNLSGGAGAEALCISASIEEEEQFEPLLKDSLVSVIYADSTAFKSHMYEKAKQAGKKLYYILPAVFRSHTSEVYRKILSDMTVDGFLVKSYDALAFLLEQNVPSERIRIDHNMYTWSNRSKEAFSSLGIEGDTLPLELNRREIRRRNNRSSEMLIYGYLPLMTSVQCMNKNLSGCDKIPKVHYLKDRYGIYFPVKNHCSACYNVIYNSKPLYLFSAAEELKSFGITRFRLSFTIESPKEMEEILSSCRKTFSGEEIKPSVNMEDYTYGHYKRGVE